MNESEKLYEEIKLLETNVEKQIEKLNQETSKVDTEQQDLLHRIERNEYETKENFFDQLQTLRLRRRNIKKDRQILHRQKNKLTGILTSIDEMR